MDNQNVNPAGKAPSNMVMKIVIALAALAVVVPVALYVILSPQPQTQKPSGSDVTEQDITRLKTRISTVTKAVETYKTNTGKLPVNLKELLDYKDKDGKAVYIEKIGDPWKKDLFYKVDGEKFKVFSSGPDGKEGTPDDVTK